MDYKQANDIIQQDKADRQKKEDEYLSTCRHYRIYTVNVITSFFHLLPHTDIVEGSSEEDRPSCYMYLLFDLGCKGPEVDNAIKTADKGKIGVCVKSRWTTYLIERI